MAKTSEERVREYRKRARPSMERALEAMASFCEGCGLVVKRGKGRFEAKIKT